MAPKSTATRISKGPRFTWPLWTIMLSYARLFSSIRPRWSGRMTWSAHHCTLHASAVVSKPASCSYSMEPTSMLKTIVSGHLFTTPLIMATLASVTPFSSGRPTMMFFVKFEALKTNLPSIFARVTTARRLSSMCGGPAKTEISTWFACS